MTLLGALKRRYDRLASSGDVPVPGFAPQKISFCLVLDPDGSVVDVEICAHEDKGKLVPQSMVVPAIARTSGIAPAFLWDKTAYALGVTHPENGSKRVALEHAAFVAHHREILAGTDDPGLRAFLAFIGTWDPSTYPSLRYADKMIDTNVVFRLEGLGQPCLHDRPAARAIVANLLAGGEASEGFCLVTGEHARIARLHPMIKGVRGAQTSGAAIVSFNQASFTSYGLSDGENAPVSEAATFAYTTALNALLAGKRRVQIGDASVVFWVDLPPEASEDEAEAAEDFELFATEVLGGDAGPGVKGEIDEAAESSKLFDALAKIASGRPQEALGRDIDPETPFYILGLSPNVARLSIRFFLDTTIRQFADRLKQHYDDLMLEPRPWKGKPPAPWRLLLELAAQRKSENISAHLSGEITRAILGGGPYPRSLLTLALCRLRADHDATPLRAALIKASLLRRKEMVPVSLDHEDLNTGYRLGRLFAILETVQRAGVGDVNATIRDRYIGAASATPARVFPILLRGAQDHLSAARKKTKGWAISLEKQIQEVMNGITASDPFPATLDLDDQGRFFVGYYHQQAENFKKRTTEPDITEHAED